MSETQSWDLIRQRPGPNGWIEVVTKTYRMPDGAAVDWDIMAAHDAVAVVAVTESGQLSWRDSSDRDRRAFWTNFPAGSSVSESHLFKRLSGS